MKSTEEMKNLRALDKEALLKELASATKEYTNNMLKVKVDKLDNYSLLGKNKAKVARIMTIINEFQSE
ncbi:MAG: 50S ribosomal protein L29 [Patescibacteria group bacterium]|jgi:ribosomal protein L29